MDYTSFTSGASLVEAINGLSQPPDETTTLLAAPWNVSEPPTVPATFVWATFDVPDPADSTPLFGPGSMDSATLGAVDCLLLASGIMNTVAGFNAEDGFVNA